MIAAAEISASHAMWCGFSRAVFSPKYLSEPSEQAPAGPYTSDAEYFRMDAGRPQKQAP